MENHAKLTWDALNKLPAKHLTQEQVYALIDAKQNAKKMLISRAHKPPMPQKLAYNVAARLAATNQQHVHVADITATIIRSLNRKPKNTQSKQHGTDGQDLTLQKPIGHETAEICELATAALCLHLNSLDKLTPHCPQSLHCAVDVSLEWLERERACAGESSNKENGPVSSSASRMWPGLRNIMTRIGNESSIECAKEVKRMSARGLPAPVPFVY